MVEHSFNLTKRVLGVLYVESFSASKNIRSPTSTKVKSDKQLEAQQAELAGQVRRFIAAKSENAAEWESFCLELGLGLPTLVGGVLVAVCR